MTQNAEYGSWHAETLAEFRGCVDINPCWPQCVEVAEDDIREGRLTDAERAQIDRPEP